MRRSAALAVSTLFVILVAGVRPSSAYSVLTHEAIIDSSWDDAIVPALRARFPVSADALRRARAYAYGGCIIQDIGYYPLSSRLFGDLTHYVRGGDFIRAMIRDARDVNELAFALGALAHYAADNDGHQIAVNPAVPMLFPKLAAKYGTSVTYERSPSAHLRTEFAFDVLQVARGRYLSDAYHDFIGFEVSKPLLERAFLSTYGLELGDVFGSVDTAIGTLRWTVGTLLPKLVNTAWASKRDQIEEVAEATGDRRVPFTFTRDEFEREYGHDYRRPGFRTRLVAWLVRIVPKIGPFKPLAFKAPTPEAQRLFLSSFGTVVAHYRQLLAEVRAGRLAITDRNFDTGRPVKAGEYGLVDETYASLLGRLASHEFAGVDAALRADLLNFYRDLDAPIATKRDGHEWRSLLTHLDALKTHGGR
jgi:hypothetical protein